MKTLNGYEVVDAKARQDIENIEVPTKVSDLENDKGYLTEHQDLSTYATKTFVNNAVAAVEPDLTPYATKTYVTNTVQAAIDDIPEPDLSDYAKKTDIPDTSEFITSIPAEYITETELNNKGYITEHQSLNNYYTRGETDVAIEEAIEDIEFPETDISGKADLVHQHSMADITDYVAPDLSEYAKKTDIPVIPEIPSLDGYATEKYVDDAIAAIDIPEAGDVDLSNYYTKEETDTAIHNSKDTYYLDFRYATAENQPATADMIEFATRWLEGQNVCAHVRGPENGAGDVNGYQAVTVVKSVGSQIHLKPNGIDPAVVSNNGKGTYFSFIIQNSITYGGWIYRRHEVYQFAIATTDYVDNAIENAATGDVDLANYYTKAETDTAISDAIANIDIPEGDGAKVVFIDASSLTSSWTSVPDDYVDIFRKYITGECRDYIFYIKFTAGSGYYQSTRVHCDDTMLILFGALNTSNYTHLYSYALNIGLGDTLSWSKKTEDSIDIATEQYVDDAIQTALSGIATAEGGSY